MFGLFQTDLPIGKKLWLALLAIVVGGSIDATPLAKAASDPISFGVNLLLLFGQATFITTFIVIMPIQILIMMESGIKKRIDEKRGQFFLATELYDPFVARLLGFLVSGGYVITIFWIANDNFSTRIGSIGLAWFLFNEIFFELQSIFLQGYEYLELQRVKDIINARIIREEIVKDYKVHKDWFELHAYLGDNNWELLKFSETYSLNRRSCRKRLIPPRWLEIFPMPLANIYRKLSNRYHK